jgi:hypothetical protein
MAAPFAYELGVFDPTFPGITLHFPNEATWQKSGEIAKLVYALTVQDLLARNPEMSVKDMNPTRVVEQIFEEADTGIPLSPEEKDALGREFIARDPDNAVANLAVASAYEHERRHFHDWLLSPYTAAINAMRSEVFVNSLEVRRRLHANGTTVIPVPLSRWLRKSEAERQALVGMWQSLLGGAARIQLPDFSYPGLTEAIETVTRRYRSIGMLFEPVEGTQVDGAAVFEASALNIQIQAIHDIFGETASNLFGNAMAGLASPSRYGWFPQAMMALRRPGEILENDTLTTIATWCLLGNEDADSANAHPLIRLNHALQCVEARGFSNLDKPAGEILEELDASSGVMPYRDLLEHSIELGGRVVQQLGNVAEDDRSGSNLLQGIAQAHSFLYNCHVYMGRLFMDDPAGYCQPVDYLDRSLGKLLEPPLRHTFGRPFYAPDRATLDQYDKVTLFKDASSPDKAFIQQAIAQTPKGVINLQIADNWQYLCGRADTIFAEFNRDNPEIDAERTLAKESGIRYMEVLT